MTREGIKKLSKTFIFHQNKRKVSGKSNKLLPCSVRHDTSLLRLPPQLPTYSSDLCSFRTHRPRISGFLRECLTLGPGPGLTRWSSGTRRVSKSQVSVIGSSFWKGKVSLHSEETLRGSFDELWATFVPPITRDVYVILVVTPCSRCDLTRTGWVRAGPDRPRHSPVYH